MKKSALLVSTCALALSSMATSHTAYALDVVTSIKPFHALAASVLGDAGTPYLLVKGSGSPHTYTMRPTDAAALEGADVVVWGGHGLEAFLASPLETLGSNAKIIELEDLAAIELLPFRDNDMFGDHEDEHGHEEHADHKDEHGHEEHEDHKDEHGHEEHEDHKDEHDHEEHEDHKDEHGHVHGANDLHFWLDPENAKIIATHMAKTFSEVDPENAATYEQNAANTIATLNELSVELGGILEPAKDVPFVVFHDSYQYLEKRFDLHTAGAITLSPEVVPGAKRVKEIQHLIADTGAKCVFSEPQFDPKLVAVVSEGTTVGTGVLDPLGANIEPSANAYNEMMRNLATEIVRCLTN